MLEIVICDSDSGFTDMLETKLKDFYACRDYGVSVRNFSDGQSAMRALGEAGPLDLLFLNTKLADMSGFVVADMVQLSPGKKDCRLIFMSSSQEDVFETFFYQPVWFIRKQFVDEELEKALNRLWALDHRKRSILIHEGRSTRYVRIEDIQYFESEGHYLCVKTEKESYRIRGSMIRYEELLRGYYFVHPSKRYLVNCAHVASASDKILMKDGSEINCSKGKKAEVKRVLERYLEEVQHCL
ncbi:MAG: DNA-binding response regulator [Lachnospiraceae bacterium]|nr:DNA-binding response regulator [Lachnospiraceae bacterium]